MSESETKKIEELKQKVMNTLTPPNEPEIKNGSELPIPKEGMEEKVGFLNCHLFEGTTMSTFYKKIVFEDEERAKKIINYILNSNTEVFMLAEVWSSTLKELIIQGVRSKYKYSYYPKNGKLFKLDSGLVYLSKKKILKSNYINYKNLSSWDKGSTKCI